MEGNKNKPIYPDPEFDLLISRPRGITETVKRNAKLEDTIEFLPKAMRRVVCQTEKIAPLVLGDTLEDTCYNIWRRLYRAIRYQKDDAGKEQIRSPRCTWWGRRGDCDDFSVFVSSILCNLGIPHLFRIAMYTEENGYQHIYPVAIAPNGREIVIDCVLNKFNKEVPFIKKIDKEMDLQFLDGVDDEFSGSTIGNIDAQDLLQGELGELGKKFRDTKLGKKVKEGLHKVNRVNPATALLRAGVLACMKINMFNVAGMLRYSYLSDEQAKKKGIHMDKFPKLKSIREKLEKIFYGAGGKLENLKKAILTGRGNRNKDVPLSGFDTDTLADYGESTRLPELLGDVMYETEMGEVSGLGELGVATEAAIAAATSAMAALAALLKQLGPLKPGGDTADPSADASSNTTTDTSSNTTTDTGSNQAPADSSAPTNNTTDTKTPTDGGANSTTDTPANATDKDSGDDSGDEKSNQRDSKPDPKKGNNAKQTNPNDGWLQKAKAWAKENPKTAAGVGIAGTALIAALCYGGYKLATRKKGKEKSQEKPQEMSGVSRRKKKKHGSAKIKVQRLK